MEDESRKIRKLEQNVVNKIAAGEIIIQPANALKEMLENSIDAHSTMIEILVREGGLKLLQITDNGDGIDKDDLPLLCERFATSKLSKFEDLESISTYGFRGEALASISHISRLSVVTKSKANSSPLAYKAFYLNGKLCGSNFKGNNTDPKPIAGKDGTQIIVEDLFYNIPSRLKSIKSKNEEYNKILDVVGKYALHNGNVGLSLKKYGEFQHALMTGPNLPIKERIRIVYGAECANEILNVSIDGHQINDGESLYDKYGLINVKGAITNCNFNYRKRMQTVFFINHRLVTCDPLRRAIQSLYLAFLPKGYQPFVYISLELKPQIMDVNVHPTKREVRFLNEDEIIESIISQVHAVLTSVDTSRSFKTQLLTKKREQEEDGYSVTQQIKKYRQENKMVRVDSTQPKLVEIMSQRPSQKPRILAVQEVNQMENVSEEKMMQEELEDNSVVVEGTEEAKQEIPIEEDIVEAERGREEQESDEEQGESEEQEEQEIDQAEEQEAEEQEAEEQEAEEQEAEEQEAEEQEAKEQEAKEQEAGDNDIKQKQEVIQLEKAEKVDDVHKIDEISDSHELENESEHLYSQLKESSPGSIHGSNSQTLISKFAHNDQCHEHTLNHNLGDNIETDETTFVDITEETKGSNFDVFDDTNEINGELTYVNKKRVKVLLDSIIELREEMAQTHDDKLTNILKKSSYVGLVDEEKRLCSFQYDVNLYLCDYSSLLYEFYYQILLSEFCNYGVLEFSTSFPIKELLLNLVKDNEDNKEEKSIDRVMNVIVDMKDMYEEYFNIQIIQVGDDYHIRTLPMIAKSIVPTLNKLPYLLYRLGTKINYHDEKQCLQGIMRELSLFYIPEIIDEPNSEEREQLNNFLEQVVFPLVKTDFSAPKSLSKNIIQIADLPSLYRIFERC